MPKPVSGRNEFPSKGLGCSEPSRSSDSPLVCSIVCFCWLAPHLMWFQSRILCGCFPQPVLTIPLSLSTPYVSLGLIEPSMPSQVTHLGTGLQSLGSGLLHPLELCHHKHIFLLKTLSHRHCVSSHWSCLQSRLFLKPLWATPACSPAASALSFLLKVPLPPRSSFLCLLQKPS